MRMLCKSGRIVTTRNVTWAHIPDPISPNLPPVVLASNGAEECQSGGDNTELKGESGGQLESTDDKESGGAGEGSEAESTSAEDDAGDDGESGREWMTNRTKAAMRGQCT